MSKSRINVNISSQTRVNITRGSGSQVDVRPVTPPMMYQPVPGAAQQPQMMLAAPASPPQMMAGMMQPMGLQPQQFMQQPPSMAFAPQPQMAFCSPPMMYGQPGSMYASTSGGYPNWRDGRDWDSDQPSIYRPLRGRSSRSNRRVVSSENARGRGGGVDKATLAKLEAGFKKLQDAKDCKSLLKKYLTKEVFDKLKTRKTGMGATLLDVIQSGVENLDSGVGIYAPDAESYRVFADLFDPVIQDYHKFKPTDRHPPTSFGDLSTLKNVDPTNDFVVSTRIRCARSLQGYPFNPCLTETQYREMEMKVVSTLNSLDDELSGTYYPLTGMDKKVQQQLIDDHFLFKEGDRFLQAANSCRFWPTGRGIYHNDAKTFLVWVNEEDHLRIISMQKGGNIKDVFSRLVKAVKTIEKKLPFSRDDRFGYLTFCPTNLGTTIRASVHIKIPKLSSNMSKLEEIAAKYELQIRGTRGEHTASEGGVYDVSNKRRLGLTEYDAVRTMQDGILELIKLEKAA
ncbi:arginine kinase-like isoform X1 [Rhipicephalus microplus]|uniref:arginine kinase-like isoform X1 n=1 Tax=Rhipicephalus microplus TaxID=6941 RepID=UPI003F6C7CA8